MRNVLITLGMVAGLAFAGAGVATADHTKAHKCQQAKASYQQIYNQYPAWRPYLTTTKQQINAECGAGYIP